MVHVHSSAHLPSPTY